MMADPLVVPALVGAAVADLLHRVLEAAGTAISCRKQCKRLQSLLEGLKPLVTEAIQQHQPGRSVALDDWLQKVKETLQDAEVAVQECNNRRLLAPLPRYKMAERILEVMKRIEVHCSEASMAIFTLTISNDAEIRRCIQKIRDDVRRMSISLNARIWIGDETSSSNGSTESALHNIRNEMDNLAGAITATVPPVRTHGELHPVPDHIVGLDSHSSELREFLVQDEGRRWVGVWGRGGSGKTLLAQRACNDVQVRQCFGEQIFWITVAMSASVLDIQCRLGKKISSGIPDFSAREDGTRELFNKLLGRKALIVLDDVWEEGLLEWLDVLSERGSKMLITSRNLSVLERVNAKRVKLDELSEEDSWNLFRVHAFPSGADVPQLIEDLSRLVAAECKGLPLALKVIGGTLAGARSGEEWRIALNKLREVYSVSQEVDEEVFQRLKLSYDALPAIDSRLQVCFLYFAAFPEGAEVDIVQLVRYWKGEKMLGLQGDDEDDDAFYLLGVLVGRSLIERSDRKSSLIERSARTGGFCKIHDILRDLAVHIGESPMAQEHERCLFKARKNLEEFPSKWVERDAEGKVPVAAAERISLMNTKIACLPPCISARNLRVLLLNNNPRLMELPRAFLRSLTKLKVLDLSATRISSLPTNLGSLELLVHLDLSFTNIFEIPSCIGKLGSLELLNFFKCSNLSRLPSEIRHLKSLKSLNTLSTYVWKQRTIGDTSEAASLQTLTHLTSLRDLAVGSSIGSDTSTLPIGLSSLVELRSLILHPFDKVARLPEEFKSLKNLQTLCLVELTGLEAWPSWIVHLPSLRHLELHRMIIPSLPALDALPQLETLRITSCWLLRELPWSFTRQGAFPALKSFTLRDCTGLMGLPRIEAGALPNLAHLMLRGCPNVTDLPPSLRELTTLTTLCLYGMINLNSISNIDFSCFKNLQELDLRGTKVTEPSSLPGPPLKIFRST